MSTDMLIALTYVVQAAGILAALWAALFLLIHGSDL